VSFLLVYDSGEGFDKIDENSAFFHQVIDPNGESSQEGPPILVPNDSSGCWNSFN